MFQLAHFSCLRFLTVLAFLSLFTCGAPATVQITESGWTAIEAADGSEPVARHEAAFARVGDKFYLLGGRGIKPVSIYDTKTGYWTEGQPSPVEIHHFQPVVYREEIYLLGAMTGGYPGETPLPNIYIYNPAVDEWRTGAAIPEDRARGGAGAVLHDGKIYLVCGIRDGHRGDHKKWLDEYDPQTDTWQQLPDAPRARDHFQAVIYDNKLYALAGRTTVAATNPFANLIGEVDVFDFATNRWSTLEAPLPTLRAGNAALAIGREILVVGGESTSQEKAHAEVEALDTRKGSWRSLPPLIRGRHGTGVIPHEGYLYVASGCGNRGGQPELSDMLRAELE